ncbi:hypothetical protein Nepgr_003903 [Nepenthes gracilis]|uniref:Uncharacterized protein n=1 Tax=Nepenthes gracilis TaxID=150966 RepID=A0AAD3S0D3_NEPGR|nr:hypothetical protein Nepgr_003903 [Nepenthes gracilis]
MVHSRLKTTMSAGHFGNRSTLTHWNLTSLGTGGCLAHRVTLTKKKQGVVDLVIWFGVLPWMEALSPVAWGVWLAGGSWEGFLVGCYVDDSVWLVVWCPGQLVLFICCCLVAVSCCMGLPLVCADVQLDEIGLHSIAAVFCLLQGTMLPLCIDIVL